MSTTNLAPGTTANPPTPRPDGRSNGRAPNPLLLGWAFVERQTNLWKRHWAWELVWLVYGVVNTLAITFIAKEAAQGAVNPVQARG